MALNAFLPDYGAGPPVASKPPLTYDAAGVTPGPVVGPGGGGNIGGNIAPAVFNQGPSLPNIPGATVTNYTNPGFLNPTINAPAATPAAPTPPAAPSGGNAAPFSIDNLPGVANQLALEQQGLSQLGAALDAARQRAIINYGDPALASMAGFGLDPQAGAFAQQNYLSGNATKARLDRQHQLAQQAIINRLASHGLLQSGDLGYQSGQENQAYGNSVYDAQQSVLSQLDSLLNNYTGQRQSLEQQVNDARMNALNQYLANPDLYASVFGGSTASNQIQPSASQPSVSQPSIKAPTMKKTKAPDALSRYLANAA